MTLDTCPRCQKLRPLGPWSGEGGGHLLLCAACKVEITMADPARRERIEKDIDAIFAAVPSGSGISELLAPFAARGRQRKRT